jgi:hypothetical protein
MMVPRTEAPDPRWEIEAEEGVPWLSIVIEGDFDLATWSLVMAAIPETPGFKPGLDSLVDARAARFLFTSQEIRELVRAIKAHVERRGGVSFRSAYVVSRDVDYGISRMIQTLTDESPIQAAVFRSMDEAEQWLLAEADPDA